MTEPSRDFNVCVGCHCYICARENQNLKVEIAELQNENKRLSYKIYLLEEEIKKQKGGQ